MPPFVSAKFVVIGKALLFVSDEVCLGNGIRVFEELFPRLFFLDSIFSQLMHFKCSHFVFLCFVIFLGYL